MERGTPMIGIAWFAFAFTQGLFCRLIITIRGKLKIFRGRERSWKELESKVPLAITNLTTSSIGRSSFFLTATSFDGTSVEPHHTPTLLTFAVIPSEIKYLGAFILRDDSVSIRNEAHGHLSGYITQKRTNSATTTRARIYQRDSVCRFGWKGL